MINALLGLYIAGIFSMNDSSAVTAHTLQWDPGTVLSASAIPQKDIHAISPVIKAKAAIAVDLKNGIVLYEKNIYSPLPIASLTKLMTATIILEENDLSEIVTVSKNAAKTEGTKIWLPQGEKISVENLLLSVLIPSANDAATALAEYNSGTTEKFAEKMNLKAREIGLLSTRFINPTGLDEQVSAEDQAKTSAETARTKDKNENMTGNAKILDTIPDFFFGKIPEEETVVRNLSTAYDLALLARYAYGKSFIRRAVIKKEAEIGSENGSNTYKLKNTNELLGSYLKVLGLKTGTTDEAGACLIAIIQDENGNEILTVVLNSPERYTETKLLADWVFRAYKWN